MKAITRFFCSMTLIFFMSGCFNNSSDKKNTADNTNNTNNTTVGSDTISLKVTSSQPNGYIDLKVVDEATKLVVSALTIDISPTTDKTDGSGGYTKQLTGLDPAKTYTVLIIVDTDNDIIIDGTDIGQMKTGISPGTEALLNNLQTLKRINVTGTTDVSLANNIAWCGIGRFDYTTQYFPNTELPGYFTFAGVNYDAAGLASVYFGGYLPVGTYGNILCMVDLDNSDNMSTGDKYQFIPGPVVINSSDTVKTYALGAWSTY